MPIHLTFNNIRNSDAVSDHVHHAFEELIKITDEVHEESYHVVINCSFRNKLLASKADHKNLYKALSKGIDSMKTQVTRKADKVRG
jgi:ribosome-associated translation inhibitor RaiA